MRGASAELTGRLAPASQDKLFPAWRHHAIFTDSPVRNCGHIAASTSTAVPPFGPPEAGDECGSSRWPDLNVRAKGRDNLGADDGRRMMVQAVRLSIRIGLDVGWGDPAAGSMVRPAWSPTARPVAITGLVIPLCGAGSMLADRSPCGPISHSW
jgi:hypothetical protein